MTIKRKYNKTKKIRDSREKRGVEQTKKFS